MKQIITQADYAWIFSIGLALVVSNFFVLKALGFVGLIFIARGLTHFIITGLEKKVRS